MLVVMKARSRTSFKTSTVIKHCLISDSAVLSAEFAGRHSVDHTHLLAVSVCVRACFCETLVHIPAFHICLYITSSSCSGLNVTAQRVKYCF